MKPSTTKINYRLRPLPDLLNMIALHSDNDALQELVGNRRPYSVEGKRLDLPSFIREAGSLDSLGSGRRQNFLDCAYDMTLDKFSLLPVAAEPESTNHADHKECPKPRAIDCRNYYRAVLSQYEAWRRSHPFADKIDTEIEVCGILQRMVVRHFYLSLKECRRAKMPFSKRYIWNVKGEKISLRRPVDISGADFRKWLEKNIADVDPKRSGEGMRIQEEADRHFSHGSFVSWSDKTVSQVPDGGRGAGPESTVGTKVGVSTMALTVAKEKVATIDTMRPAIQGLGRDKLYLLITRIFQDIEDGIMEDIRIANDFGLSKATFSRFAGSDWTKPCGEERVSIPDLWLNTAKVLASSPEFTEIALSAGVLPQLKEVLKRGKDANV